MDSDIIDQSSLDYSAVQGFTDALIVEQYGEGFAASTNDIGILNTNTATVTFKDAKKSEPPQCILFDRVVEPGITRVVTLPNIGVNYDVGRNKFLVWYVTAGNVFNTYLEVKSQSENFVYDLYTVNYILVNQVKKKNL